MIEERFIITGGTDYHNFAIGTVVSRCAWGYEGPVAPDRRDRFPTEEIITQTIRPWHLEPYQNSFYRKKIGKLKRRMDE